MRNKGENDGNNSNKPSKISETLVMDFGTRAISNQNASRIICLPKTALANIASKEIKKVNVKLIQSNGIKVIQLSPIIEKEMKGG